MIPEHSSTPADTRENRTRCKPFYCSEHVCVLAVESSLLTPSWQGKMDGLCYRFLADTSPYNRLISYYQQPQTLKLIFIGVKKEIPHGIVDLYGSHLSMVIFF